MTPPCVHQTLAGESLLIMGSTARQCPFRISILTSVRRIVKIAVRFLHTKTAPCDRKDTQSRFAVNTARSIVCVGTCNVTVEVEKTQSFNAARGIMCVGTNKICKLSTANEGFNAARSIVCVGTPRGGRRGRSARTFQCRTQHCVCRDLPHDRFKRFINKFQCRTQHCVCRD